MSPTTTIILSFVLVSGVTLLAGILLLRFWPTVGSDRLTAPPDPGTASISRWDDQPRTGWQRTLERLGRAVSPREEAGQSKIRQRLIWAGYYNPLAIWYFLGSKVALAIGLGCAYPVYGALTRQILPHLFSVSVILGVIGLFLPDYWLRRQTHIRQREISNALPDILDLLTICVEAGMAFDAAVARVAEQPEARTSPLHQELMRMHLEVRSGRPRAEALRALGERTGVEEVKAMVGAFIQTEKLGTPLGKTLRVHADSVRMQRRHRAEKQAHLAPLKMLFPTVFFLMPAFFLVALAPSLLGLAKMLNALGGTR